MQTEFFDRIWENCQPPNCINKLIVKSWTIWAFKPKLLDLCLPPVHQSFTVTEKVKDRLSVLRVAFCLKTLPAFCQPNINLKSLQLDLKMFKTTQLIFQGQRDSVKGSYGDIMRFKNVLILVLETLIAVT